MSLIVVDSTVTTTDCTTPTAVRPSRRLATLVSLVALPAAVAVSGLSLADAAAHPSTSVDQAHSSAAVRMR